MNTFNRSACLLGLFQVFTLFSHAAEPWADDRLPVRDNLELWFDASHQNAARGTLQLAPLAAGNSTDYLLDGSSHARHLVQALPDQRPRFRQEFTGAFLSFDGKDDSLAGSRLLGAFSNLTVFVVASPRANAGLFRALFGLSQAGRNDYLTGLNFDLGPSTTPQLSFINAEGRGFGGALSLLQGATFPFGQWHTFALTIQAGPAGVRLFLDGQPRGSRDSKMALIQLDEFVLGARHYSNGPEPAHTQGFFDGNIAEFLLFSRVLSSSDREAVEKYLSAKYAKLLALPPTLSASGTQPVVTVTNPPPVQMLVPGFAVRALPLSLTNINNLKYRPDGKLVALAYNGHVHLLTDTDGDGLEDKSDLFWGQDTLRAPIGLALTPPGYPRGQGVFVAAKGKVSLIVDTNGDDRADQEIIVADGWKELAHGVDALGVALDRQGNVYFGLGAASYTEAYLIDKATGESRYDLNNPRGTILKVSPDFKQRQIICTGIRFPVALAFNREGDLFCTDQEGATWLPNGNPFDELLHIRPGRHYGFPPRHPKYLPHVVDEPSVFDYAPQHQSTCGLNFNEPLPLSAPSTNSRTFGPAWWAGDALVAGYSRGKLWRTKLVKAATDYVAQNQLIACLNALTVDACVSPRGDLVLATHSGQPDWGSGPNGQGKLYQVRYIAKAAPQPLLAWSGSPTEIRIAFDHPLEPARLKDVVKNVTVTQGKQVFAGDRFETLRPGYQAVADQQAATRYNVPVLGASVSADGYTLTLMTPPRAAAVNYAVTLPSSIVAADGSKTSDMPPDKSVPPSSHPGRSDILSQHPTIDLLTDLSGLDAEWKSKNGNDAWQGWLPHLDLAVARALTVASSDHTRLWQKLTVPGQLTLRGQLNLWEMLQPAVQPGSKLDYERPVETVTVIFSALTPFHIQSNSNQISSARDGSGRNQLTLTQSTKDDEWLPFELSLGTGSVDPDLQITWHTGDDPRPRAFALRRFLLPWATPRSEPSSLATERPIPELAGGRWLRGKKIFFGDTVSCAKCHRAGGEGADVGPDLSNLVHRDYASVARDIREPSAALNPDHIAYQIELTNGDLLTGLLQQENAEQLTLADATGRPLSLPRSRVKAIRPSLISLMPEGLDKLLNETQWRDLMTFLLTAPLTPAPLEAQGAPPPRRRADLRQPETANARPLESNSTTPDASAAAKMFHIVLCAGPKDHGPGEHDYPLWQKRWSQLLALADNVTVSTAQVWPSPEQWKAADVIAFYSDNPGWKAARAQDLDAFLARGGGAVFLHYAVDGHQDAEALAERIGLAWRGGQSKFRHGPVELTLHAHPLAAGLGSLNFIDESYWNLVGDEKNVELVATGIEEGQPRPLVWTRRQGKGRIFVSILGHYTWTFDDPAFRQLILRGICWAADRPINALQELTTIGARLDPGVSP